MYYDLFEKIPKGSMLLWNVDDEKALPNRKEMIRLLGTEDFSYYKSNGHHRDYVRTLARLKYCLRPEGADRKQGYWALVPTSHFLFAKNEIGLNSFFILKYSTQCLGSYFVDKSDLKDLNRLLDEYGQVRRIADEIKNWPGTIDRHMKLIKHDSIKDSVIENFPISRLTQIIDGYGEQAVASAIAKLQAWHEQHFWKSMHESDKPKEGVSSSSDIDRQFA